MLTSDYINLRNAVGRVIRLLYVLSFSLTACGFIVIFLSIQFISPIRTWFVVVFALPALFFIVAVYIYESRVAEPLLQIRFYMGAFVSILFLLMPSFFIVYRYLLPNMISDRIVAIAGVFLMALLATTLNFIYARRRDENIIFYFMSFIKAIMWEPWGEKSQEENFEFSKNIRIDEVMRRRSLYYVEKKALQVFQSTLSCPYVDASIVTRLVLQENLPESLSVLDIGGGEGRFTAEVLSELQTRGHQTSELVVSDPVNWQAEYQKSLSQILPQERITILDKNFENLDPNLQFDIVLASHSLYATWDYLKSKGIVTSDEVARLLSLSKPEGFIVVIMASKRGLSYHFKTRALRSLFGTELEDSTMETFQRSFVGKIHKQEYVDNLIDLTDLIKDFYEGGELLYRWLSYFLRYDIGRLRRSDQISLVNMLLEYVNPLDALPERELQRWINHESFILGRDSKILMHKTKVVVLRA